MKIIQKCGPCGGELTIECEHVSKGLEILDAWRDTHRCLQPDQRTGVGFAATSTSTDSPQRGWRHDATGPRRVEAAGQRTLPESKPPVAREETPNT